MPNERKPLTLDDSDKLFEGFETKKKKELPSKDLIDKISSDNGFTPREQAAKTKVPNKTITMSIRVVEPLKDLLEDIQYLTKKDKKKIFEDAIYEYLKKNQLTALIEKYKNTIK